MCWNFNGCGGDFGECIEVGGSGLGVAQNFLKGLILVGFWLVGRG